MAIADDLLPLVVEPAETLAVEHKSWLDLTDTADRARLAKAVIAMANHGGGTLVVGMRENSQQGGELVSHQRPTHIKRYGNDSVNAAVAKFATPAVHCEVHHVVHPTTGNEHAIIKVPGDTTVPVMSSRLCEGVLQQARTYVRKPGPRSEEASTPEEWAAILERCVQARRVDMLDAIRNIVLGQVVSPATVVLDEDPLKDFMVSARDRLLSLVSTLPEDSPARMPRGKFEFAFKLMGNFEKVALPDLRRRIDEAHEIKLTGWPAFLEIGRQPYTPSPVGNGIETWLGRPDTRPEGRYFTGGAHADFWRIQQDGCFYMVRGYQEDESDKMQPGYGLDITLPIWRLSEALLFVFRMGSKIDGVTGIAIKATYSGLAGRRLATFSFDRYVGDHWVSVDDEITLGAEVGLDEVRDNLVEVIYTVLQPLYERFSFFVLRRDLVAAEIERLTKNRH